MSRIFRCGTTYAIVEHEVFLGYICIEGKEEHITRRCNVDNVVKCQNTLEKITGLRGWKWIA
jgi:hypothetical protein